MILSAQWIDQLVFGGPRRRFTQDSPILPDVWTAYGAGGDYDHRLRLLLNPWGTTPAGKLAEALVERLKRFGLIDGAAVDGAWESWLGPVSRHEQALAGSPHDGGERARAHHSRPTIGFNQSTVVARLTFGELLHFLLPLSGWWQRFVLNVPPRATHADREAAFDRALSGLEAMLAMGREDHRRGESLSRLLADPTKAYPLARKPAEPDDCPEPVALEPQAIWMLRVAGAMALGLRATATEDTEEVWHAILCDPMATLSYAHRWLTSLPREDAIHCEPLIYAVALDRPAATTVSRSVPSIKADSAARLFEISAGHMTWAVVDSGIDATHPAFRQAKTGRVGRAGWQAYDQPFEPEPVDAPRRWYNRTRVKATYDFRLIRYLLDLQTRLPSELPAAVAERLREQRNAERVMELRRSLTSGREIDWGLLAPLLQVRHDDTYAPPKHPHGTHVAGILAGDWSCDGQVRLDEQPVVGVCPDLNLIDLRVLDDDGAGDEFSIVAALQFVRHLNANKDFIAVHGVNLSLAIPHNVRNYACGRTPVCEECDRVINGGAVVVAAAGNLGHEEDRHAEPGSSGAALFGTGYRSISITDPGNDEAVITVGATHRSMPHTYGVSYFSSRGPTGDGRCKPDLVAPGEKITAPVPGNGLQTMDGTSMAAPHVSGSAALLMARHSELAGQPRRVKQILCETATDLGRERYFQGAGMVDILRALQSI